MSPPRAEILQEYGPFDGTGRVNGVTHDGVHVWFADGDTVRALDPATGETSRALSVPSRAGTAFDGRYLFQLSDDVIRVVDPQTGEVLRTLPAPAGGSGLTWAEGSLWVGQYGECRILRLDPETGAILRTIVSDRFVTGVTWVQGALWHGIWDDAGSELRRIDAGTGEVLERLEMPPGTGVSGLEADGAERLYCGGGEGGKVRAVRRPKGPGAPKPASGE
jgi:glutamine cyclotransferase